MNIKIYIKWLIVVGAVVLMIIAYYLFDPLHTDFFPKCPFKRITGFDCPGCGSQRAVHALLNFKFRDAVNANILLVFSIPYIIAGFIIDSVKAPSPLLLRWRKRVYGVKAIWVIFSVIILFWIVRNIN